MFVSMPRPQNGSIFNSVSTDLRKTWRKDIEVDKQELSKDEDPGPSA